MDLYGLHYNSKEWQRPQEFLPERFDHTHPLYLTPSGQKRHPNSWNPFSGGRRVCFGKTFAEMGLKMMLIIMCDTFNFEFVDPRWKTEFTKAHFAMASNVKLELKLTLRE